jgi:hypothetical protein
VPVAATADLLAFMGGDNGLLSLVSIPEVKSYADLKGRTLSVDALTTGYAFVLFDMLRRHGLAAGNYRVEKAGEVLARWQALQARQHDGTLLLTPFDLLAKAAGFNVLEYAIDLYGHYQGLVSATRRAYARDHPAALIGYIAAIWPGSPGFMIRAAAKPPPSCARTCRKCRRHWRNRATRLWSLPGDLPRGRKSTFPAFVPCSSCAAATVSRAGCSPIPRNITTPNTIRRRSRTETLMRWLRASRPRSLVPPDQSF